MGLFHPGGIVCQLLSCGVSRIGGDLTDGLDGFSSDLVLFFIGSFVACLMFTYFLS